MILFRNFMNAFKEGDLIIGKVVAVRPYAVFMSFDHEQSGLLHISEISDAYIRDIEKYAVVGDELKVKVIDIDEKNGFLRVSLKQVPPEEAFTTHENMKRGKVELSEDEFKTLSEKLPEWIEEAYQKAKEDEEND